MSCQEYFKRVSNVVDVIKNLGATLLDNTHLVDELLEGRAPPGGYTENHRNQAQERILDKKITYGLLVRANRNRFGSSSKKKRILFSKKTMIILTLRLRHKTFWLITRTSICTKGEHLKED
jgi:hypothetical protein